MYRLGWAHLPDVLAQSSVNDMSGYVSVRHIRARSPGAGARKKILKIYFRRSTLAIGCNGQLSPKTCNPWSQVRDALSELRE